MIAFYTGGRFKCIEDEDGNKYLERLDDSSTEKADIELLSFEERNPSFHVIDSSIHNDEWHGTPHIHIDYIPVGSGYTKGPDKQLGFMRALSQMGYVSPKDAYKEWRAKERDILKTLCHGYGLETKNQEEEQINNRGETYPVKEYTKAKRDGAAIGQEEAYEIIYQAELD